jgi:hypothetical protein
MLSVLLDSPVTLAAVIALLSLLNYAVGASARRVYLRQKFVEWDAYLPQGPIGKVRSDLALPFLPTIVIVILTLLTNRLTREIVAGGYLVLLVAGFAINITGVLTMRALLKPAAAAGRIQYSAMYRYRSAGAQTLGLAVFGGSVGILFSDVAFMAGSFFLLATAIGYYRRAQRASRRLV